MRKTILLSAILLVFLCSFSQTDNTSNLIMFHYNESGGTVSFFDENNMQNYAPVSDNQIVIFQSVCAMSVRTIAKTGYYIKQIKDSSEIETQIIENLNSDTNITDFEFSVNTFVSHNIYAIFERNTVVKITETSKKMTISPNPATDYINIENHTGNVIIYDVMGNIIAKYRNTNRVDVSFLKPGIYFINGYKIVKQ